MSNCVVGSGGSWLPCSTIAEHSVEGCDHFSHDSDDDDLGFFIGGGEAFVDSHLAALAEPPQHGIFEMSRLVLGRNVLVTQLPPHRHDLGESFDRSVPLHNSCRYDRDILCDQPRIEAVVLGQHAAGAGADEACSG